MSRRITTHIRRTDEVNITECGKLTAYDDVITDAPIAMTNGRGMAIFPDVEWPANATQCRACVKAYEAQA
jgi:hypothetical protein